MSFLNEAGRVRIKCESTKSKFTAHKSKYIRLFPLLEPPPFVSVFESGYRLLTVALFEFDLIGDCGGLDVELPPPDRNKFTKYRFDHVVQL